MENYSAAARTCPSSAYRRIERSWVTSVPCMYRAFGGRSVSIACRVSGNRSAPSIRASRLPTVKLMLPRAGIKALSARSFKRTGTGCLLPRYESRRPWIGRSRVSICRSRGPCGAIPPPSVPPNSSPPRAPRNPGGRSSGRRCPRYVPCPKTDRRKS